MAFNANFSASQGVDATSFSLEDASTGSDPNLTSRTISLALVDGSLLGGNIISWPLSEGSTKNLTGYLTRDRSINITVTWVSSSPIPGSVYTKTALYTFGGNTNNFIYGLIQDLAAQQNLSNDTNFYNNLGQIQTEADSAVIATTYGDQFSAQASLDRAYYMITKENFYF